ncbi:MAG: cobyrinate a,c-diamide synthase [Anaerolineae bacterium]
MRVQVPRLVIAGTASGVGKTTIATGLMAALTAQGYRVAPFKVGPDYIDPSYHHAATGQPSRNLDTWMVFPPTVAYLFVRAAAQADIAIIEGVMGLYDGFSGRSEAGSTAEVAKLLGAPVVLIMDVACLARSAGAMALGYREFDADLRLAGIVLNNVGSDKHALWVREAIESVGVPVLGYLHRDDALHLPHRHLGLIPTAERGTASSDSELGHALRAIRERIMEGIDLDRLIELARSAPSLEAADPGLFPTETPSISVRIAVARDEAFSFYYEDNLDLLRAHGAELVAFSPLHGSQLPESSQGVYLGGGFPEMYAEGLAANRAMHEAIRQASQQGLPIYAECGGLMYLTESITDLEGRIHPMVGLVPGRIFTEGQRLKLSYVVIQAQRDSILACKDQELRGHEFHLSDWVDLPPDMPRAYVVQPYGSGSHPRPEGYSQRNILASYIHLHFATTPHLATNFVAACRAAGVTHP